MSLPHGDPEFVFFAGYDDRFDTDEDQCQSISNVG